MGVLLLTGLLLIALQTSKPEMSGSIKSKTTRSGLFFPVARLIALLPSKVVETL